MVVNNNIFSKNQYHVNKGFQRQVKSPLNYMIKVIGIDCGLKTACAKKQKVSGGKIIKDPNDKISRVILMFLFMKKGRKRIKRTKLKKKKYEELEEAI